MGVSTLSAKVFLKVNYSFNAFLLIKTNFFQKLGNISSRHTGTYKNTYSPLRTFSTIYSKIHHDLMVQCNDLKAHGHEYFL